MTLSQILLIVGVFIIGLLGFVHLIYTLFTKKFDTRDPGLKESMKKSSPVISGDTSMWDAWIGFNLSHSTGVLFFALVYIPLAINHWPSIHSSIWLSFLPTVFGIVYLLLAKIYWFKIPLYGITLSSFFMFASFIASISGY
jgi:hypothetical protein